VWESDEEVRASQCSFPDSGQAALLWAGVGVPCLGVVVEG
jgi:hypothetical protein